MGGRRKSSKHQGIRKKKNASKQTLARVAERKQEQEAKLERKLADAEARIRAAKIGMLDGVQQTEEHDVVNVSEEIIEYEDLEDEKRIEILTSKLDNQQKAFETLSRSLKQSIFDGPGSSKRRKVAPETQKPVPKRPRVSQRVLRSATNGVVSASAAVKSGAQDASPQVVEKENHAAAVRENAQFGSGLKPRVFEGKLSTICTIPGVGKVSVLASAERRERLKGCLTTDLENFGPSQIGMSISVFSKWTKALDDIRNGENSTKCELKPIHRAFTVALREYHDLFLSRMLPISDEDMIRRLYTAHCLSHVLRCRGRVLRNDAAQKAKEDNSDNAKDQGFSRARVLLLFPFKNIAYEVVKMLQLLAVGASEGEKDVAHVANSERFETEFGAGPDEPKSGPKDPGTEDGSEGYRIIRTSQKQSQQHEHMFRGNIEDDFKLGIAISKKTMKLYTDFYASDIIIASPLGLKRTMAEKASGQSRHAHRQQEEGKEDMEWKTGLNAKAAKPRLEDADEDFLSSIEICIVDGLHAFSMQNWDTLLETLAMVNKMPAGTRDTDFSRVRDWCLDGLMARFRQSILLSSYRKPEFMSLFRGLSNHAGKVQILEQPSKYGSMSHVVVKMRQTFFKVPEVTSPEESPEKRLSFFFSEIFPQVRGLLDSQSLLVVPSYFDYVRVRNKLVKVVEDDASFRFVSMCEYSKGSDVSRARSKLFDRSVSLVVMTERFHYFWRHWIRGANTIVWYGLPENSHFYPEILNMTMEAMETGRPVQSMALYDSFDLFRLEQVVGRDRCKKMVADDSRSTFLFA